MSKGNFKQEVRLIKLFQSTFNRHRRISRLSRALLIALILPTTLAISGGRAQDIKLTESSFSAEGLRFEKLFTDFYRGNFIDVPFDRDELEFAVLLDAFIKAYGRYCDASLGDDKIMLTKEVCSQYQVWKNGYGVETRRECVQWETVPLNVYASPGMYRARAVIEGLQAGDALRNVFGMLVDDNPIGNAMNLAADQQALVADMKALVRINGCDSPGLMRFQENLRRFAVHKQPIRLGGDNTARQRQATLAQEQDYRALVEDLVYAQSRNWVMNQYQRGSASRVSIVSRDSNGLPKEITANYRYQGFGGISRGSVRITFTDGLPDCLYFFDFPNTCRTAERRVVADFAKGEYVR